MQHFKTLSSTLSVHYEVLRLCSMDLHCIFTGALGQHLRGSHCSSLCGVKATCEGNDSLSEGRKRKGCVCFYSNRFRSNVSGPVPSVVRSEVYSTCVREPRLGLKSSSGCLRVQSVLQMSLHDTAQDAACITPNRRKINSGV